MKALKITTLAILLAGISLGDTIVQKQDFGEFGPGNKFNPYEDSFTFNKFGEYNPGDWTLNSIRVEFFFTIYGGYIGQDNDEDTARLGETIGFEVDAMISSDMSLTNQNGTLDWNINILEGQTINLATNDGDAIGSYQTGGEDWDVFYSSTREKTTDEYLHSDAFAAYEETGTFDIDLLAEQALTVITGGDVSGEYDPESADGFIRITYDYTIPEPATVGLIGIAGILTLITNRVRRAMGLTATTS